MLVCVDQEKNVKVFRVSAEDGQPRRERLGVVSKKDFVVDDESFKNLPEDEVKELNEALDVFKLAARVRKHAQVLSFPEVLREVLEYVETEDADPTERKHVFMALAEGVRRMRKFNSTQE